MYSLIGNAVIVEPFHDIHFAAIRPGVVAAIKGEHPEGRPGSSRSVEPGADGSLPAHECMPVFGPHATGDVGGRVGVGMVVLHASQDEHAVLHVVETVILRHEFVPFGLSPVDASPYGAVKTIAFEIILPHQLP